MVGPPGLLCSGGGGPVAGAASGSRLADSWGLSPKGGRVRPGQRQRTRGQRPSAPDCAEQIGDEGRLGAGHSPAGDRASGGRVESGVNPGPGRAKRIAARKTRSGPGPVTDNESLLLVPVARARFARWQELPHLDTTRTQRRKQGIEPPVEAPPTACSARGRGPAEARGFRGGAWRGSRARHGGRSVAFLVGGVRAEQPATSFHGWAVKGASGGLAVLGFACGCGSRTPSEEPLRGCEVVWSWARLLPRLRRSRVVVVVVVVVYEGLNRLWELRL